MGKLFRPVLYVCGILCVAMAVFMLLVAMYGVMIEDTEVQSFLFSSVISAATGMVLILVFRQRDFTLTPRQLYLLTSCSWVMMSLLGAFPLMLSHEHFSITNAVFEAASGVTTTGSTVLSGLSDMPRSLLLWRSILQWIGGLGFIGMAVSILPFLRVGGMKLFQTESSDWSDKTLPRLQEFSRSLIISYCALTTACAASYWLSEMSLFDAVNHAMTTVSTGGYATDDRSMGRFSSDTLWLASLFMLIGGLPFTLFIQLFFSRSWRTLMDVQVLGFIGIVTGVVFCLFVYLQWYQVLPPFEAITQSVFNVISVITTTGYASADYTLWGGFSVGLFFIATFIGGCSGSTSGGMKVFRFQISYMLLRDQMRRLIHPRGVFIMRYNGKVIRDDIMTSAVAFSFLFFLVLAAMTMILTFLGLDFLTSFTGAATALTNVGPGLGEIIGPSGTFQTLPAVAKWVLIFGMILGRLELLTMMVLFTPGFWRG